MGLGALSCPVASPIVARPLRPHGPLPLEVDGFLMKHKLFLTVLIFCFGLWPNLVSGEIYQWVDKDGVLHFTDGPPPPGAERVEGLSETPPDEPQSKAGPAKHENAGAVGQGETGPTEGEDAGPVVENGNKSTYRDDYWQRKGWGNDTTGTNGPGAAQRGENPPPPDQGNTDATEGGENAPTERKVD